MIKKIKNLHLFNGDVLDSNIYINIPNDCDIVFTSPPYNVGNNNGFHNVANNNSGTIIKYKEYEDNRSDYCSWLEEIIRIYLKKAKYFFLNIQKFSGNKKDINELLFRLNDVYCDEIIIDKGNGVPNGVNERVMTNVIEYVYVFGNNNSRSIGTKQWKGTIKNIYKSVGNQSNGYSKIHNALMPLHWPRYFLENFVKPGGKVIDCFGGLFTTGIACNELGLEFYGIELSKEYFDKGVERLEKETQQMMFSFD